MTLKDAVIRMGIAVAIMLPGLQDAVHRPGRNVLPIAQVGNRLLPLCRYRP